MEGNERELPHGEAVSVPVRNIVIDRLARWSQKLIESHATPLLVVGIGHDHALGNVVVLTIEDPSITSAVVAGYLRNVIQELEK